MNTQKNLYSLLLVGITLASTVHAHPQALPIPVEVDAVKEKIATYRFEPSAGLVLGAMEIISEEEIYRLSLEITIDETVFKLSSRNDSKRATPDESSCTKFGNTITCVSDEIVADTSGTLEDPSEERTICSQPVLEISGSEKAKRILIQAKNRYWITNVHSTCQDALDRREHIITEKIAKFRSLAK
jgi:hypothetical protein